MSLHFVLKVNAAPIGACVIQRRDSGREPADDTVLTYDVEVDELQQDTSDRTATIQHRYGDGAWVLVYKALAAVLDAVPASVAAPPREDDAAETPGTRLSRESVEMHRASRSAGTVHTPEGTT